MNTPGNVYLIGFSGSGKSTIGPILARKMNQPYIDCDADIARQAGRSISAIFAQEGERSFRTREAELLATIARRRRTCVVALGGGAVTQASVRRLLRESGITVYLRCAKRELYRRLREKTDRPLLQARLKKGETSAQALMKGISELLAKRQAWYEESNVTVSTTSETPRQVARRIEEAVNDYYRS